MKIHIKLKFGDFDKRLLSMAIQEEFTEMQKNEVQISRRVFVCPFPLIDMIYIVLVGYDFQMLETQNNKPWEWGGKKICLRRTVTGPW